MTFKELKKRVNLETMQRQSKFFERLQNKAFWIWNSEEHRHEDIRTDGDCCFNHIVGLPQKDSVDKPLYDYEKIIFDSLVAQNGSKHLWIKKATGLGISEFMLRFMAWLCLKDNSLSDSQMCIVTGPRIDLAIALIDRMKSYFHLHLQSIYFLIIVGRKRFDIPIWTSMLIGDALMKVLYVPLYKHKG
jgi:hypothetical protein